MYKVSSMVSTNPLWNIWDNCVDSMFRWRINPYFRIETVRWFCGSMDCICCITKTRRCWWRSCLFSDIVFSGMLFDKHMMLVMPLFGMNIHRILASTVLTTCAFVARFSRCVKIAQLYDLWAWDQPFRRNFMTIHSRYLGAIDSRLPLQFSLQYCLPYSRSRLSDL